MNIVSSSTCGSYNPQSCLFSQICNICCVLGESSHLIWKIGPCTVPSVYLPLSLSVALWIVTIRFQQVRDLGSGSHLNTAGLVLGFISSIGISILGNFQVQYIDYKQMEIACNCVVLISACFCIISNPLWRGFICLGRSWPSSWFGLFLDPGMAFVLQPAVTWPQVGGASAHYPLQPVYLFGHLQYPSALKDDTISF